jgi:molybdate transport system ATP-binding protein
VLTCSLNYRAGAFGLDVQFESGRAITGVFGPSGAGKTTLLNLLAGLIRPGPSCRGRIELDGTVLLDTARGVWVAPERRRVGVVFQEHRLFPHYSVAGNLDYGVGRLSASERASSRAAIVEMLGLGPMLGRSVHDLSGGERQRVALGRALLASPRLLLLDEPLSSLDHQLKEQVIPYLRRVRDAAQVPMLYVSHDLREVLRLTDTLMLLDKGRIVGHGALRDLAHDLASAPLLQAAGMVNALTLPVVELEAVDGLTTLGIGGSEPGSLSGVLRVPAADLPARPPRGTRIEVAIRPEDIALSLEEVRASSFQNQLPGVVTRLSTVGPRTTVGVDVGVQLLALVSARSAQALNLRAGTRVYCLIKSLALRSSPAPQPPALDNEPSPGGLATSMISS